MPESIASHSPKRKNWRRRAIMAGAAIALAIGLVWLLRRADIDDPAVLATMPLSDLRDVEFETLIRAAFRNADQVLISTEVEIPGEEPRGKNRYLKTTVTDRTVLDHLAEDFAVGFEDRPTIEYRPYPGLEYTQVRFSGPFRPDFTFVDGNVIYVFNGRRLAVPTIFAKQVADLAGIENVPVARH